MRSTFVLASALFGVALAAPQGVTEKVTPTGSAPAGCTGSFDGNFEITVTKPQEKEDGKEKRDVNIERRAECGKNGILVISLEDGNIVDSKDRTGYIASNFQFQFDGPPQAGALFTSGFSVCEDNTLALGGNKTFFQCRSGGFYNLYDRDWAEQCERVSIVAIPCGGSDAAVSDIGDGQIVATTVAETTIITALSDGQPQVITTKVDIPLCQIGDGQVQVHTTPCASVTSYPTTSYIPISQSSDGQIINPNPTPSALPPPPPPPPATTAAPPPPAETTPEAPPETPIVTAPAETPTEVPSSPVETPIETPSETPTEEVPPPPPAETTPPPEGSAPPVSGSSRVVAGSAGALAMGFMIAFICL